MGILQAMSSTRVSNSQTPAGKDQEPLTTLGEGSNNLQLRAQSSPLFQAIYRVGKHERVTRNLQQLDDQVPLECNSQVMHLNLTQSHSRYAIKQRDEWWSCSLDQMMSQYLKCARENPQTRPPSIYSPHERIWLLPLQWANFQIDRTRRSN
jgi:hypothetical protein